MGVMGETFQVVLKAAPDPDGVPVAARLRRGLKLLLRVCRLRCVAVEPLMNNQTAEPAISADSGPVPVPVLPEVLPFDPENRPLTGR